MLSLLLHPVRQLFNALAGNETPRQMALGFTLGMILGMVPKGNLIAVVLLFVLCALRVNKAAGMMAAALFSAISPLCDPLSHKIGLKLLGQPGLQESFAWLYNQPLGPLLGFNNTVTIGSLLLAIYISYPCYYGSLKFFERFGPPIARWIARYKLARVLTGAQFAARYQG
ncbi:TIGR03546 family protein [Aeoliella mucimassa]|uniref:DUF2062 domain-containing protein n=1 Tax=Aeoliella mucimassa TaxID=2527972 RepID=A0A518ATZ9_9BACT|nr:TIGR03546 family protein [Aeoliella mucimassa]QDU58202.1 hypothetical protein Pan181_44350 [Aeoliella mucimassa]